MSKRVCNTAPFSITIIPKEIWLKHVFIYLSNNDILQGISLVCKDFNKLGYEAIKHLEVIIPKNSILYQENNRAKREYAAKAISKFRCLESLTITDGNDTGRIRTSDVRNKQRALNGPLEKLKMYTQTSDLDILTEAGFYPGFFLSTAINNCANLRHIELKGVHFLHKDFLSLMDIKVLERIQDTINATNMRMNPNSIYVLAIAYKCSNLTSLLIEDLDHLSKIAMKTLFEEHSKTLKSLRICGNNVTDEMLETLPTCQKLEKFEISCAFKIGPSGFEAISKLQNLKSLEISRACTTDGDGEDTGLSPKNFYSLFATENMKNLENLCLDGSDALYMNEEKEDDIIDIFKAIATNCPRLKYLSLNKGQCIPVTCFGILIKNLSCLSDLIVTKCYEVESDYLMEVIKESPSPCLKINHLDGIITWNKETQKVSLDSHSDFSWKPNPEAGAMNMMYMNYLSAEK